MLSSLILSVAISSVTVTTYRAVPEQTDDTPFVTSINDRTTKFGVAVSRDFLESGTICYGDVIIVPEHGLRVVNDVMNKRHKHRIDLFVETRKQEQAFGTRTMDIQVIHSEKRKCRKDYL